MATVGSNTFHTKHKAMDIDAILAEMASKVYPHRDTAFEVLGVHQRAWQRCVSMVGLATHCARKGGGTGILNLEAERLEALADSAWDALLSYRPKSVEEMALISAYVDSHWRAVDPEDGGWMAEELLHSWALMAAAN